MTVAEAAEYASISPDTVYAACEGHELMHTRIAGRRSIRLKAEWIDAWLERYSIRDAAPMSPRGAAK